MGGSPASGLCVDFFAIAPAVTKVDTSTKDDDGLSHEQSLEAMPPSSSASPSDRGGSVTV